MHKAVSCQVEWKQSHTIQLRLPTLTVDKYRSAMEHDFISNHRGCQKVYMGIAVPECDEMRCGPGVTEWTTVNVVAS